MPKKLKLYANEKIFENLPEIMVSNENEWNFYISNYKNDFFI